MMAGKATKALGRGRPPAQEPGEMVGTWLKKADIARLKRVAAKHDMSVSALVRRLVVLRLPPL